MKKKLISVLTAASMLTAGGMVMPERFSNGITTASAASALPAFPGAQGAGMYAAGGRGGKVYHVTNLNDSGEGSFRDAVSGSNRIVVFDVGGTINLKSAVIVKSNVTILGQTAPGGGGITLSGNKLAQGGSNQIIRYVSSRPGERGSGEYDAWGGSDGSNSIIDHCSVGWANDEQWGLYSYNTNQTVQYSIIGPSNCISTHAKGAHGFGVMFGSYNISWHHNMIAHNISRNFRGKVGSGKPADFVNNVLYDWGYQTGYGTLGSLNYVGNYLKKGPSTKGGNHFFAKSSGSGYENMKFYVTGNRLVNTDGTDYSADIVSSNWSGVSGFDKATYGSDKYFAVSDINGNDASVAKNAESADQAFEHVLAYAGAGIDSDSRPAIDKQVMEEARTGTGNLTGGREFSGVTDSEQLAAISKYDIKECDYETYYPAQINKTITDSDNDGMPDDWELARGLDPNKDDASDDYLGQGYMNIEYYANDLTINSFPEGVVTESATSVDLGPEYTKVKEEIAGIKLDVKSIKTAQEITLPQKGGVHGLDISWSSSSSAIKIKDNQVSQVNRASEDKQTTLTAAVSYGGYTMNKSFSVTVLSNNTFWKASKNITAGEELFDGLSAVSDMTYNAAQVTLGSESFGGYVSGTVSGGFTDGAATGTAFKFTAADNGFLTAYIRSLGQETNPKTAYINEAGTSGKTDCVTSAEGKGTNTMISGQVEAGKTYYVYVGGSKGQFLGIEFSKTAKPVWWRASENLTAGSVLMDGLTSSGEFTYSETVKSIDGEEFTGRVQGKANPTNNGAEGAAVKYVSASDGEFTIYSKVGAQKTLCITDSSANIINSYKNEGDVSEYTSLSGDMKKGGVYYIYVDGSKAELYGASFTASYTEPGDPLPTASPDPNATPTPEPTQAPTPAPTPKPTAAPVWWKASADAAAGSALMSGLSPAEDMTYKDGEVTIDGESFAGYIGGTSNPAFADGQMTGAALKFTAPADGKLTVYMQIGKPGTSGNKSMYITDSSDTVIEQYENTTGANLDKAMTVEVKKGEVYYAYVKGSKAKMYGAVFIESVTEPKPSTAPTDDPGKSPEPSTSPTEDPGTEPEIEFIKDGARVQTLSAGELEIAGTIPNPDGINIYAAVYDERGRLIAVKAAREEESFSFVVNVPENAAALKAMVWKDNEPETGARIIEK